MHHSMEQLASTFPSLRQAPGTQPWDAYKLDQWADTFRVPHSTRQAAQFILCVWNPAIEWDCGGFNALDALRCWDEAHRNAFLEWAAAPWWP